MKTILSFACCAVLVTTLSAQSRDAVAPPLAITRVNIVDVERGAVLRNRTVVIQGDVIESIVPADAAIPTAATRIDGRDGYLIPGLWDMHVHVALLGGPAVLPVFVAHGVTGVRDAGSPDAIYQWRDDVAASRLIGPRIVAAGRMIDGPGSLSEPLFAANQERVSGPAEIKAAVSRRKQNGAYVKLQNGLLGRDLWRQIADEATRQGLVVGGHVPVDLSLTEAIHRGLRSIEHSLGLPIAVTVAESRLRQRVMNAPGGQDGRFQELILADGDALAEIDFAKLAALASLMRERDVVLVPTLTDSRAMGTYGTGKWNKDPRLAFVSPATRKLWLSLAHDPTNVEARLVAQFELVYRKIPPVIRAFHRAGVKILAGTDAGAAFDFPGSDLHSELWHLVQAGLTPAEALRAATSDAAAFVGLRDSLGTVAPKKIADLVLLERNPLDDIANTSRIAAVVLRGRYYERATLDQLLAAAKEAMSAMAGQQP